MSERCERCGATFANLDQLIAHAGDRTSRRGFARLFDPHGRDRRWSGRPMRSSV